MSNLQALARKRAQGVSTTPVHLATKTIYTGGFAKGDPRNAPDYYHRKKKRDPRSEPGYYWNMTGEEAARKNSADADERVRKAHSAQPPHNLSTDALLQLATERAERVSAPCDTELATWRHHLAKLLLPESEQKESQHAASLASAKANAGTPEGKAVRERRSLGNATKDRGIGHTLKSAVAKGLSKVGEVAKDTAKDFIGRGPRSASIGEVPNPTSRRRGDIVFPGQRGDVPEVREFGKWGKIL